MYFLSFILSAMIFAGILFWFESAPYGIEVYKRIKKIILLTGIPLSCLFVAMVFNSNNQMSIEEKIISIIAFVLPPILICAYLNSEIMGGNVELEAALEAERKAELERMKAARVARARVSVGELLENEKQQRFDNEVKSQSAKWQYGTKSDTLVCPHCQTKGFVRKKSVTRVQKTRVNSFAARAIGLGTNTETEVTQLHCDNCDVTWDV